MFETILLLVRLKNLKSSKMVNRGGGMPRLISKGVLECLGLTAEGAGQKILRNFHNALHL